MSALKGGDEHPPMSGARAPVMVMTGRSQDDLPDRWCFGLSHPYIQRLIFLAGEVEQSSVPAS